MYCKYCGKINSDTIKYCQHCGAELQPPLMKQMPAITDDVPPVVSAVVPPAPPVKPVQKPPVQPIQPNTPLKPQYVSPAPALKQEQKKNNKGLIIGLSVGGAILVIAIIVVVLIFVLGNQPIPDDTSVNNNDSNNSVSVDQDTTSSYNSNIYGDQNYASNELFLDTVSLYVGETTIGDMLGYGFTITMSPDQTVEAHTYYSNVIAEGKGYKFYINLSNDTDYSMTVDECTLSEISLFVDDSTTEYNENARAFLGFDLLITEDELTNTLESLGIEYSFKNVGDDYIYKFTVDESIEYEITFNYSYGYDDVRIVFRDAELYTY